MTSAPATRHQRFALRVSSIAIWVFVVLIWLLGLPWYSIFVPVGLSFLWVLATFGFSLRALHRYGRGD